MKETEEKTHILVPRRISNQILHDMLRRTRSHSTSLTRPRNRHLRPPALPRVHPLLLPPPLTPSVPLLSLPEHRQRMRRDDRWRRERVRHVFDRRLFGGPFVEQQFGTVEGGGRRVEDGDLAVCEAGYDLVFFATMLC